MSTQELSWFASRALTWLLAGQTLLTLVVLFVPFGFDHPSRLGLDFEHLLLVLACYALLLIGGLVAAARGRRWGVFGFQLLTPCVIFALGVLGILEL